MPVGMTLQQLYSNPPFDNPNPVEDHGAKTTPSENAENHPPNRRSVSQSTSTSMQTSTVSAAAAAKMQYGEARYGATDAPQSMAPRYATYPRIQQPYDARYQPPPYDQDSYGQYGAQPYSVPYNPGQSQQVKTNDEYVADPLPFEYANNLRKFADNKAMENRMPAQLVPFPNSGEYPNTNGQANLFTPVHNGVKNVDDQPTRVPAYMASSYNQTIDRPHYAPVHDASSHYAHSSGQLSGSNMYSSVHSSSIGGLLHMQNAYPAPVAADQPKKEVPEHYTSTPAEYNPPQVPQSASQEAVIKVKTPLKPKYWRNGRRNLQCFPSCKVFGDYAAIKIEDLKQHDFMWGKCRGSIVTEVTLNSNVSFDDILILGRVHSLSDIPVSFEEAVIRECMLGRMVETDAMETMKENWIIGERLPDFVQQDAGVACFEFKPKVWKYQEDMAQGKCKRRNVKYYVQFEAFVMINSGDRKYYACIGSGMSTSFEVGSSRVLARQKRKAASNAAEHSSSTEMKQSHQQPAPHELNMPSIHPQMMVPTSHPMMMPQLQPMGAPAMYMTSYPNAHPMLPSQRSMNPAFSLPHYHQEGAPIHHHPMSMPQNPSPNGIGQKRKLMNDLPGIQGERGTKLHKSASPSAPAVPL